MTVQWYPLRICTSDPRLLPVAMWRHTGRRSGSRNVGGKQQSHPPPPPRPPETYIYMKKWSSKHTSSWYKAILKCLKNRYSPPSPSRPAYFSIASYPNESNDKSDFRSRHVEVLLVSPPCSFTQSMFINIASLPWSLIKENANPLYVVPKSIATTARYVDFGV